MSEYVRQKTFAEKTVANNIKVLRDLLGLNHERFAERVGLSVDRVKKMEEADGTLDDCIDLLRIAQSCNVQYLDLFEGDAQGDGYTKVNAHVGKYVMSVIDAKRIKECLTKRELCDKVGAHWTMWAKWVSGKANPSPMTFNNLVVVLGLRYFDFVKTKVEEPEEDICISEDEPDVDKPDVEFWKTVADAAAPVDDFEARMLKVIRLQRKIDSYLEKLDEISNAIYSLRNELASMK